MANNRESNRLSDFTFEKDGITINYDVVISSRRTLSISIKNSTRKIEVKIPQSCDISRAHEFIELKFGWIVKALEKIETKNESHIKREWHDGAQHLFMGKSYTLKVIKSRDEGADITDEFLVVRAKDPKRAEAIVRWWYGKMASRFFAQIGAKFIIKFEDDFRLSPTDLSNKYVKSYWGVCRPDSSICLNTELIRAPRECIEYIIVHELCHLKHRNHSKAFYALVAHYLPDWKERSELLNNTISCHD